MELVERKSNHPGKDRDSSVPESLRSRVYSFLEKPNSSTAAKVRYPGVGHMGADVSFYADDIHEQMFID